MESREVRPRHGESTLTGGGSNCSLERNNSQVIAISASKSPHQPPLPKGACPISRPPRDADRTLARVPFRRHGASLADSLGTIAVETR